MRNWNAIPASFTSKTIAVLLSGLLYSAPANAWFFFIPGGLIQRALETDPDSIIVNAADRSLGKCAGYHVNQHTKFSHATQIPTDQPGAPPPSRGDPAIAVFHRDMADLAISKAAEKQKVIDLASAYSTRWGRVASADQNANRAYGTDLVKGCVANDIPYRLADYAVWKERLAEQKRAEEEKRAADQKRVRDEADKKALSVASTESAVPASSIDFTSEARKSARILGCSTQEVRVTGTDGKNIFFSATCESGEQLALSCDSSGLCLKR